MIHIRKHDRHTMDTLWACAWFTEIVFVKRVCVYVRACVCVPIYVCPYTPT